MDMSEEQKGKEQQRTHQYRDNGRQYILIKWFLANKCINFRLNMTLNTWLD